MKHRFNSQEGQLAGLRSAESKRLRKSALADIPKLVREVFFKALRGEKVGSSQLRAAIELQDRLNVLSLSRYDPHAFDDDHAAMQALLTGAGGPGEPIREEPTAPAIDRVTGEHDKWCRCRDCLAALAGPAGQPRINGEPAPVVDVPEPGQTPYSDANRARDAQLAHNLREAHEEQRRNPRFRRRGPRSFSSASPRLLPQLPDDVW